MLTHWTAAEADAALADRGAIVDIGQLGSEARRHLDRRALRGEIVKYRGYWNTLSPRFGIGPLKTIYRLPLPEFDALV